MYRPVILIGNGFRKRGIIDELKALLPNIPMLTTWMAADMIEEDDKQFCGRPGILGQRAANIIQQKATHLYCFGARLDGEQVAYDYDRFAPNATVYVHDVDDAEFKKYPPRFTSIKADFTIANPGDDKWVRWCRALYNYLRPELEGKDGDPFEFVRRLGEVSQSDDLFAIGSSGNAPTAFYQAFKVKKGQRIMNASSIGAMGADIPMALGAALGSGRRTICFTGDGGFQLNAQELQTIRNLHLPIVFFVLNNGGYASIRTMQDARFEGRRYGCDPDSRLVFPPLEELAGAYGVMYKSLKDLKDLPDCFVATPMIVEVYADPSWQQLPRVMASEVDGELKTDNMEDMTPKLHELEIIMNSEGDDPDWFEWAKLQ